MANLIFDLSGIYDRETFYHNNHFKRLDLRELSGTYGFCDDVAATTIRKAIADEDAAGLHFLDNGNYHYLSLFFLEKIATPFELILFDHHSDAGEPAFGGLLSCGDWVRAATQTCENLKHVIAVGPDAAQQKLVDDATKSKILFLDEAADLTDALAENDRPVYISLDKDVLSKEVLPTDWDQGDMRATQLFADFAQIKKSRRILGMDICGEAAADANDTAVSRNNDFNQKIVSDFMDSFIG